MGCNCGKGRTKLIGPGGQMTASGEKARFVVVYPDGAQERFANMETARTAVRKAGGIIHTA